MRKTNVAINPNRRLLTISEAATYIGMGQQRAKRFCDNIGATKRFSARSILYDKFVIDKALNASGERLDGLVTEGIGSGKD